jgi:hypothetical protein
MANRVGRNIRCGIGFWPACTSYLGQRDPETDRITLQSTRGHFSLIIFVFACDYQMLFVGYTVPSTLPSLTPSVIHVPSQLPPRASDGCHLF